MQAGLRHALAQDAGVRDTSAAPGALLALAACLLVAQHLRFDAADPHWHDRDRVVVAPEVARLGALLGRLASAGATFGAHRPALGCGVGLALAERMLAARFGRSLVDHRCWVLCSADALASGPMQEAAWLAGAWRLGRLTVLAAAGQSDCPGAAGFAAQGWAVRRAGCDDPAAVSAALSAALRSLKPTLVLCVGPAAATPDAVADEPGWASAGRRLAGVRRAWLKRLARHGSRTDFDLALTGRLPGRWHGALSEPGPLLPAGATGISTAATLRAAVARLGAGMAELAVLPGLPGWAVPVQSEPPETAVAGRLAGGMAAAAFGVALHGGLLPLAMQPAGVLDDLVPALRAAARAGSRLVHIVTEPDPAEGGLAAGQRAGLRAMENLMLFRPADAAEALECLELALRRESGPSVLLVSEASRVPGADRPARTRSARGGYIVAAADGGGRAGGRDVTLVAGGPELAVALAVRDVLAGRGVTACVVSLPCWELFALQEEGWRRHVLGDAPRIGLEAGSGLGWDRWLGEGGMFLPGCGNAHMLADAVLRHLRHGRAT